MDELLQKSSHEEWLHWAQVVIDRLTTCVHVYSKPPHDDVFLLEKERQDKNARTLDLLRRVHTLTDDADTPTESLAEVAYHDERVIAGLAVLMQETLDLLPELSTDMQKLLKSPWHSKCAGRLADELFRGPMGNENEGIGSGHPGHGRLPAILENLLERERSGDSRKPRDGLHRESEPRRHDETKRRWADKNSQYMRSAGRIE
jgi:hypothetical protein